VCRWDWSLQPNITSRSADSVFTNGGSPESVPVHASGEMHQCSILPGGADDASVSDIQKAQFEYLFVSKVDAMTTEIFTGSMISTEEAEKVRHAGEKSPFQVGRCGAGH
jgi:hypothetical protein